MNDAVTPAIGNGIAGRRLNSPNTMNVVGRVFGLAFHSRASHSYVLGPHLRTTSANSGDRQPTTSVSTRHGSE